MKQPFQTIIDELGYQTNITLLEEQLENICESVVKECVELINAHAKNMEAYNFTDKANTAHTCAGMILEYFDMKDHHDQSK